MAYGGAGRHLVMKEDVSTGSEGKHIGKTGGGTRGRERNAMCRATQPIDLVDWVDDLDH